jgi:hypothetical protein
VTTGGGGAPPCGFRSPQLTTKVASAINKAALRALRISRIDENDRVRIMNA